MGIKFKMWRRSSKKIGSYSISFWSYMEQLTSLLLNCHISRLKFCRILNVIVHTYVNGLRPVDLFSLSNTSLHLLMIMCSKFVLVCAFQVKGAVFNCFVNYYNFMYYVNEKVKFSRCNNSCEYLNSRFHEFETQKGFKIQNVTAYA